MDQRSAESSNGESISSADRLWDDLAEDDDEQSRCEDGGQPSTKVAQEDGQGFVHDDVSQQQDDQYPMLSF